SFFILHEGAIAVSEEQGLEEISYKDLLKQGNEAGGFTKREQQGGWIGLTDKYWAAALLPPQDEQIRTRLGHVQKEAVIDYSLQGKTIAAGEQIEITQHYFAGAKEVGLIDHYKKDLEIHRFDLLIDWGWFYFLTKPLFLVIDMLYGIFGNFGVAILMMTILIKLLFFPLANKSYVAMGRMKKLQPRIAEITKTHKDNPQAKQLAIMALYKQEKVNPLAGCLPVLIQIPVFFALYKVLFVTIEMRHQPFFGWIHDLSAPDPTNIFTLFGLLPISLPAFLTIGIWPICMGFTMFVQMQMNPAPPDPIQKRIFFWMPIVFTFVLAGFPAGLVIYWTWNNMLSVLQQGVIMRRQGVRIELWDNLFSRKKNDQD
ncbi:MAG: membrane protein insertase YidC, partial [Parvibaculales bacterium]